jgi:hypothetical protein
MIVIVTGSRDTKPERAKQVIEEFLDTHRFQSYPITFIHGYSGNVDNAVAELLPPIGESKGGRQQKAFLADWHTHGKSAGPIRNRNMVKNALSSDDHILGLAVWDGKSKGTLNCIQEMVSNGIKVVVHPAKEVKREPKEPA